jgi:putative transposase
LANQKEIFEEPRGRRSIRLKEYDYAQEGAYFITICTHQRHCVLGGVFGTEVKLNEWGIIVHQEWYRSVAMRTEIESDAFVVMPNHIHGIILIHPVGASGRSPKVDMRCIYGNPDNVGCAKRSLASFIAGFKSAVTTRVNTLRGTPGKPFWQRNYHEHIIRDVESLYQCRTYIEQNPLKWAIDKENPECRLSV